MSNFEIETPSLNDAKGNPAFMAKAYCFKDEKQIKELKLVMITASRKAKFVTHLDCLNDNFTEDKLIDSTTNRKKNYTIR